MAASYTVTDVIALPNLLTSDRWSFFLILAIMRFKEGKYIAKNTQNEWTNDFLYHRGWGETNLFNNS